MVGSISVYIVTRPRPVIPLTVSGGSTIGTIKGNLTSVSSVNPLSVYFNVTAYANQTENPGSTLAMQILTRTFYVGGPAGHYYDGGYVQTIVEMTIHGHFASNLHPGLLMFTINQTGQQNGKGLDFIWSTPAEQRGTNVTFDHNQELTFFGTGTATGMETLVNDVGAGPYYDFTYGDSIEAWGFVGHTRFVGINTTVTGPFTPPVSVAMVLTIIDVPVGGNKPLVTFSAVDQSSGNATITVTGASQSVYPSNYKVNLQVGSNTGAAVAMPTTGGLYVTITINSVVYRIYWTDIGGERTVNPGDNFRVTGNNLPLSPAATLYTFYLLWSDGSLIQQKSWSTP